MDRYCPIGKTECGLWELKSEVPFLGLLHCRQIGDSLLGCNIYQLKFCPWPSRQVPVEPERELGKNKLIYDKATKTIMCNGKTVVNMKGLRIINGLYIVDETPVEPTLDTVSAYQAGRADMKREIGEKVKELPNINATYFIDDVIAAIEEVK